MRNRKSFEIVFWTLILVALLGAMIPNDAVASVLGIDALEFATISDILFTVAILLLVSLGAFLHAIQSGRFKTMPMILILFLTGLLHLSFLNNSYASGRLSILSIPIGFIYLFIVTDYYSIPAKAVNVIKWTFTIWSVVPVLLILILGSSSDQFIYIDPIAGTFGGFSGSRNGYGLYGGLALLMLLLDRSQWKWILIILIAYGFLLAQSRTIVLSLGVSLGYYVLFVLKGRAKYYMAAMLIVFSALFYFMLQLYSVRDITFAEDSNRALLIASNLEFAMNNLYWGGGGGYSADAVGAMVTEAPAGYSPAHNFILETITGYGIFVAIAYFYFLYFLWRKYSAEGRVFLLYMFSYGMSQPGMGLRALSVNVVLLYICMIYYAKKENSGFEARAMLKKQRGDTPTSPTRFPEEPKLNVSRHGKPTC